MITPRQAVELYFIISVAVGSLIGLGGYLYGYRHGKQDWKTPEAPADYHELLEDGARYVITRQKGNHKWVLYAGPSGDLALRWFEHVRLIKDTGEMWFMDNGVQRDYYNGDAK